MDNDVSREICQVLRRHEEDNDISREICQVHRHEEITQSNSNALLVISAEISELEQACFTHNTNVMSIWLLQRRRIDSLESECNTLGSLLLSMWKLFLWPLIIRE